MTNILKCQHCQQPMRVDQPYLECTECGERGLLDLAIHSLIAQARGQGRYLDVLTVHTTQEGALGFLTLNLPEAEREERPVKQRRADKSRTHQDVA